jgi:hypothetical protein
VGSLLAPVVMFLILLSWMAVVGGAIWLFSIGEWRLVLGGLAAAAVSPFLLGLVVMLGGLLFGVPGALLIDKGRPVLGTPLIMLSLTYIHLVVAAWCIGVFVYFMGRVHGGNLWPLALWSYTVALSPWVYMAGKEVRSGGGDGSSITVFFAQIAFVSMAVVAIFFRWSFLDATAVFLTVMLVSVLVQTATAVAMAAERRYAR